MTDETVTPTEPTDQPDHYAEISAELHRLAVDISDLIGSGLPKPYFCIDLHPHGVDDAAIIAGVDAIAGALLGKPGKTYKLSGGGYHHGTRGARGLIDVSVYDAVSDPAERDKDAELERLRAENSLLRGAVAAGIDPSGLLHSREPESTVVAPVPAGVEGHPEGRAATIAVADGHVVHECCGKLDDAAHQNFCAAYAPAIAGVSAETLALVAQVEKALPSMQTPEFSVIGERMLSTQVCTSLPDDEATARINAIPAGTSSGWSLSTEPENAPVACADQPETHRHLVFDC